MKNIIVTVILIAIAASIIWYLVRAKKQGATCIGCPHAKQCRSKCGGNCNCESTRSDT